MDLQIREVIVILHNVDKKLCVTKQRHTSRMHDRHMHAVAERKKKLFQFDKFQIRK